uniref:Putative topoisomerase n=1 Tax=viral metagenome TaxID=1070528 RepID=A0A6H1ZIB0_9ZZZZ
MEKKPEILSVIEDIEHALEDQFEEQRISWDRNILKDKNQHWIGYNTNDKRWYNNKSMYARIDPHYPTPQTNVLSDKAQTIRASMMKAWPSPYVTHRIKSERAKRAARSADIVLKHYEEVLKMKRKTSDILGWCLFAGGCIGIPYANNDTGKFLPVPLMDMETVVENVDVKVCSLCGTANPPEVQQCQNETCQSTSLIPEKVPKTIERPVPRLDKTGNPLYDDIPLIEPGFVVSSYYEWLFDPFCEEIEDMRWIIRRRIADRETVEKEYKDVLEGKKLDSDSNMSDKYWYLQRINSWPSSGVRFNQYEGEFSRYFLKDSIPFREYLQRPKGKDDKGRYVIVAGSEIVHDGAFPWEDGKWHYCHFRYRKSPGSFYGISLADDIGPLNDIINRIDQQIIWNRHVFVNTKILNPSGSGIANSEFYGKLGTVMTLRDVTQKPEYLQGSALSGVMEERNVRMKDMESLSVSDPTGGKMPQGRVAAAAIEMVLEQSAVKLSQFAFNVSDGLKEAYKEILRIFRTDVVTPMKFTVIGESDEREIETLKGEDLEGEEGIEGGGLDIRIDFDSVFPASRAAMKQVIVELLQYHAFNPQDPFHQSIMYKIFGFDKEGMNMSFDAQESAAKRENMDLEEGKDISKIYAMENAGVDIGTPEGGQALQQNISIALRQGEDSSIHYAIHRQDLQREKFDKLDPKLKAMKIRHFKITEAKVQQEAMMRMQQQAQMAQQLKGAPDMNKMQ